MTEPGNLQVPAHAEMTALAWYLQDKLPEAERRNIARHLETCAECRAELASLTALAGGLRKAYDSEPHPSPDVKRTVMARVAADSAGRSRQRPAVPRTANLFDQLRAWLGAPLVPRWAPAALLVLVAVQAGVLVQLFPGNAVPPPAIATRGLPAAPTRLRVAFNPLAAESQIREILGLLGAHIVDGPSGSGAYVIELRAADPKEISEKLRAARARPDILQSLDVAPP
jgi:anti-sigma factor RsiW